MRSALLFLSLVACAPELPTVGADTGALGDASPEVAADVTAPACGWEYQEQDPEQAFAELPAQADALVAALGPRSGTMVWQAAGRVSEVSLELSEPGRVQTGTPTVDGCAPHLLVELDLALSSDDGSLAEAARVTARAEEGEVVVAYWVPLETLGGDYDPGYADTYVVDVGIWTSITDAATVGEVRVAAQQASDATSQLEVAVVATW